MNRHYTDTVDANDELLDAPLYRSEIEEYDEEEAADEAEDLCDFDCGDY